MYLCQSVVSYIFCCHLQILNGQLMVLKCHKGHEECLYFCNRLTALVLSSWLGYKLHLLLLLQCAMSLMVCLLGRTVPWEVGLPALGGAAVSSHWFPLTSCRASCRVSIARTTMRRCCRVSAVIVCLLHNQETALLYTSFDEDEKCPRNRTSSELWIL